ncbi:DMT family transporter [Haloarchaeobius sp. HRN-SO-5]|uniref:DMT family transporter n=1 Tax=Haloarchaeobius sp. HRN-SO-5 TaxID=3446118 RepID=UPI003EBDD93C
MTDIRRYVFALAPLAAAALWGGMYVVSKWSFGSIPPLTLGFLRVVVGGAVLLLVLDAGGTGSTVERADWPTFAALGGWVTLTNATQFVGTELTTASEASLLTVLTPVATVFLGAVALGERVTPAKAAGIAIALAGTVAVVAGQYDLGALGSGSLLGVALLLAASVAWAAYTVQGVRVVRRYSALTAATYATVASVPMLGALSAVELAGTPGGLASLPTDATSVLAVLYLGVGATATAWYLWYKGLEYVPAGTISVFFFAQPVVGAALGAALLGETLGPGFAVGGALMALGIWVVSRERDGDGDEESTTA